MVVVVVVIVVVVVVAIDLLLLFFREHHRHHLALLLLLVSHCSRWSCQCVYACVSRLSVCFYRFVFCVVVLFWFMWLGQRMVAGVEVSCWLPVVFMF